MTLLTVKEVAAKLQVNIKTLYAWTGQGKIPYLKLNGLIRFEDGELDQWVESCRARADAQVHLAQRPPRDTHKSIDRVFARAKRAVYTPRHGETRPTASPEGKEDVWGS